MIDLYTWPTPNGRKISILLEAVKAHYNVIPMNNNNKEVIIFILFVEFTFSDRGDVRQY